MVCFFTHLVPSTREHDISCDSGGKLFSRV